VSHRFGYVRDERVDDKNAQSYRDAGPGRLLGGQNKSRTTRCLELNQVGDVEYGRKRYIDGDGYDGMQRTEQRAVT
jgi:hypothetical protein